MTIEQIEDSIVARLAPLTVPEIGIVVRPLPEKESELNKAFAKPTITVQYHSSAVEMEARKPKIDSGDLTAQKEIIHIDLLCQSQKLRGATGIWSMFTLVRALLIGFKPTNCRKMYLVGCKFVDHDKQVWDFVVTLGTETVSMEQPDTVVENLLKQIRLNENSTAQEGFAGIPDAPIIQDLDHATPYSLEINIGVTNGVTGFEYDISTSVDFSIKTSGVIDNVQSWVFTGLASNTTYHIRLRGKNDEHVSENGNVLSLTTSEI